MGEVLTVLPFQNTLATFQLSGKDIVASLEHGVSGIEEGKGQFPQVSGLRYSFDGSVAPNAGRIKSVEVMEGGSWAPIDEAKTYLVATNNFTRGGGDGYELFASNAVNAYDYGPGLEQVVADYLAAHRPYTPALDGRITALAAAAPAAEASPAPAAAAPAAPAAPAETAAAPAQPASGAALPAEHTVAAGDTLWDLAEKYYGNGARWNLISDANQGLRRSLRIGQKLTIPAAN
jgi:5'-nucleotidase